MKHHIIVKFNEQVTDKAALIEKIAEHFAPAAEIDGINAVTLHPSVIDLPNRYDLAIVLHMDKDALPAWAECEIHKAWKKDYGHLLQAKTIFDCD